ETIDLRRRRALRADPVERVRNGQRAVEQQADRGVDVLPLGRVEAGTLQTDSVRRTQCRPVALGDRERWNVLVGVGAPDEKRVGAEPDELRDARVTAEQRMVLDDDVPRELAQV